MEENQVPVNPAPSQSPEEVIKPTYAVPWSIGDTWLGVFLLVLVSLGMIALLFTGVGKQIRQSAAVLFAELVYLAPVILIFAWRRISWKELGFGKFPLQTMGIGCGLLLAGYVVILLHNLILYLLGISTQGDQIAGVFSDLKSPVWLFITGVVVAPLVEEMFFRGFLFQGFRQRYGLTAAIILSSAIFGAAHLDPVAFIPTAILGAVLAYVYHRANSLWPGIIFHASINAFGLCTVYLLSQYPHLIPS